MANFDYLNYLASQSKIYCNPTDNLSMSTSQKLAQANNETYKKNNGKYPDRPYR